MKAEDEVLRGKFERYRKWLGWGILGVQLLQTLLYTNELITRNTSIAVSKILIFIALPLMLYLMRYEPASYWAKRILYAT